MLLEFRRDKDFFKTVWKKVRKSGYKITSQRKYIVDVLFGLGGHISVEELFDEIRKRKKTDTIAGKIGIATVYRTLKILKMIGLVSERDFGDGRIRYEVISGHHDHLICTRCGLTIEFSDAEIEERQREIARKHSFFLVSHRHELLGICQDCYNKEKGVQKIAKEP